MTRLKDFLPGAEPPRPADHPVPDYDDVPGRPALVINGTRYYQIGALAAALQRSAGTIREWERTGVIPPGFSTNPGSRNGRRRLYSRDQILLLRELARECGVLDNPRATVKGSEFARAAAVLFEQLREATA